MIDIERDEEEELLEIAYLTSRRGFEANAIVALSLVSKMPLLFMAYNFHTVYVY